MPDISQFDQEFLTAGSQGAEGEKIAGLVQKNLTPEEQKRLEEIIPILEEFNMLMYKAQTGEELPTGEEMGPVNEQGMVEPDPREGMVPQDMQNQQGMPPRPIEGQMPESAPNQGMQNQQMAPPRPIEGQMPESAPEMMAEGGWTGTGYRKTDINRILQLEDKPDWLERALDPSSPMTKENESIRSATAEIDGQYVLFPTIRMVEGKLEKYKDNNKAYDKAKEKQDFIVLPAKTQDEADLYSKALSNEIGKKRQKYQGMQMGGVAAGPVGVINEQGADGSGVADDVPAKSDGFVINAAAVRHAGLRDINDMIQNAKEYAKKQGMKLNFGKTPTDAEKILVSNGEVVIPDVLADIIGYDRLEKINKRGEKETEKVIQEEKQQQQQPPPPQKPTQPVMRAVHGGEVKDEEGQVEELLPPEEDYIFNNPETAEFLKEAEGTIAYQTKTGSYDPETKKFLTYLDSEGVRTIAYGTTEKVQDNMEVSEKEADKSLGERIDLEKSMLLSDKIPRKFLDNPKTRTAIISLQYNLGRDGWPKAKEALQKGDLEQFLFYAYDPSPEAANTYLLKSEGLLNRRNKEMKLFKEGLQEMGLDN